MKKFIFLMLLLSIALLFISCEGDTDTQIEVEEFSQIGEETTEVETKPSKYTALEFSASDSGVGANHKTEIVLKKTTYSDTTSETLKSINFLDTEYNVKYDKSEKGYYHNEDLDLYKDVTDGYIYDFSVNRDTGRVDKCILYCKNYAQEKEGAKTLTEDKCKNIAVSILNKYENADAYTLTNVETTSYIMEGNYKVYRFWFTRIIDGIETKDKAYIVITEYGDLDTYIFTCLGEMKDVVVPTEEELSMMRDAVDEKVKSIYANVEKSYGVEYEIRDEYFVRLADGKYAMEYVVDVDLTPNDPEGLTLKEKISLLVYV